MEGINSARRELLIDIAKKYYIENMSQEEIARSMHMSRSNISRLLKSCMENRIVEVKINDVMSKEPELALAIKKKFQLIDVLISPSQKSLERSRESAGVLSAQYLQKILKNGMVLGITPGRTSYYVAHHVELPGTASVDAIQLVGGTVSQTLDTDSQEITKRIARKLNGSSHVLHAPHMVKTKLLKDLLLQEPSISDHFKKFEEIDVALLGIGSSKLHITTQMKTGSLSKADSLQLIELGAVADICGKYFDINGKTCNAGINERAIAIDLETLQKIPVVIGVAAGLEKVKATLSILRSGIINVLIIDEYLAQGLKPAI